MDIALAFTAALLLALIHIFGYKLAHWHNTHQRRWISVGGGVAVAYIFLQLLPELQQGQKMIEENLPTFVEYLEHHLYLVALLGLLIFYGIEKKVRKEKAEDKSGSSGGFWLHIVTFSVYNVLIGDLLLERIHEGYLVLLFFTIAMAAHFLVNDLGLFQHHQQLYKRFGRWFPAAGVLLGFTLSIVITINPVVWMSTFALIAGGTILNALKEELPEERESSYLWFFGGALVYAAVLLIAAE